MKLIMAIILSLLLAGCITSQGGSHDDSKVIKQEVHKQGESDESTNLKEREGYRQSSQY
jgi:uncharacterized protein YcfL